MRNDAPSLELTDLHFGNMAYGAEVCILNTENVGKPISR
jgi:hypothetical protein